MANIMIKGTIFSYSEEEGNAQIKARWKGNIQSVDKETTVYLIEVTDSLTKENKIIQVHRTKEGDWLENLFNDKRDRDFIKAFIEAKKREEAVY